MREFFETLAWTQVIHNHSRLDSFYAPDMRNVPKIDRIDGLFDTAPRVVDVRKPRQHEGWHNIPNVGIFLYRLVSSPLLQVSARPDLASGFCDDFGGVGRHPTGHSQPADHQPPVALRGCALPPLRPAASILAALQSRSTGFCSRACRKPRNRLRTRR
jgi:hypothetical protein